MALSAQSFMIKFIDGRDILVPVTEIINPKTVIKLDK